MTFNKPALTEKMAPSLIKVVGAENMRLMSLVTGAEDFAYYAQKVPSLFFMVGSTTPGQDLAAAPSNHSDYFFRRREEHSHRPAGHDAGGGGLPGRRLSERNGPPGRQRRLRGAPRRPA